VFNAELSFRFRLERAVPGRDACWSCEGRCTPSSGVHTAATSFNAAVKRALSVKPVNRVVLAPKGCGKSENEANNETGWMTAVLMHTKGGRLPGDALPGFAGEEVPVM
jgi:hypothetical protein